MRACLLAAAVACAACQSPFDPASYVTGLRVLGVKAEPPEIAPGESTTLTALVVHTDGAPITIDWTSCVDPATPSDPVVNLDCVLADAGSFLTPLGQGTPVAATMPRVPPQALGLFDYTGGFYLPIRLRATTPFDEVRAVYRLRYKTGFTPQNHNPVLTNIVAVAGPGYPDAGVSATTPVDDGAPPVIHAGESLILRALIDAYSLENFPVVSGDPRDMQFKSAIEEPRFLWYSTGGTLTPDVTKVDRPDVTLKLDKRAPAAPATIEVWVVVHDERGGSDWMRRTILVR